MKKLLDEKSTETYCNNYLLCNFEFCPSDWIFEWKWKEPKKLNFVMK